MTDSSSPMVPRESGTWGQLVSLVAAVGLQLTALIAAVQAWFTGWPGRSWLTAGVIVAVVLSLVLGRRWRRASLWIGVVLVSMMLLAPAYLFGADGGGLRILGGSFDTVVAILFVFALALAGWQLASLPRLPLWARLIPVALGIYAAAPAVMALTEGIPFDEALIGLWTHPYWLQGAWIGAAILLPAALIAAVLVALVPSLRPKAFRQRLALPTVLFLLLLTLITAFEMNGRGLFNALGFVAGGGPGSPPSATSPPEVTGSISASAVRRPESPAPAKEVTHGAKELVVAGTWEEVFSGVRDRIAFEPTRGAMRSPRDVLLSGRGNSLEQARLLAVKLEQDGLETRYVRGTLDPDGARGLLRSAFPKRVEWVGSPRAPLSEPPEDPALLQAITEHYWVQLREGNRWLDLDPSFPTSEAGSSHGQPVELFDNFPESLAPTVRLQLVAERTSAPGRFETVLTWSGLFENVANLPLGLTLIGRGESVPSPESSGGGHPAAGLLGGFGGGQEERADTKESLQDTRLIWEATLSVAEAAIATGTVAEDDSTGALQRLDLLFEIDLREGRKWQVQRPLFELGVTGDRPGLYQRHSVLITGNRIPESFFKEALNLAADRRSAMAITQELDRIRERLGKGQDLDQLHRASVDLERRLGPESGHLINLAFAAVSDRLADELGEKLAVASFYDSPRILINSFEGDGGQLEISFDLRLDSRKAVSFPGQALLMRETFLYGRGVLESVLEGEIVKLLTGHESLTTAGLVLEAERQGVPVAMYSHREREAVEDLPMPEATMQKVLATIDRGKIVVLPERGIDFSGRSRWAWWEIEPATREAIGVLDTGLHQATVQYTLIETEGAVDNDTAWAVGAITGAVDTQWVLSAVLLEYGEMTKEALEKAKAYLGTISGYLCWDVKVGHIEEESETLAEASVEIEGCWEEGAALEVGGSIGAEVTIIDKGWCEAFQSGFQCASIQIMNHYLRQVE